MPGGRYNFNKPLNLWTTHLHLAAAAFFPGFIYYFTLLNGLDTSNGRWQLFEILLE